MALIGEANDRAVKKLRTQGEAAMTSEDWQAIAEYENAILT